MPNQIIPILPNGRINRRELPNKIGDTQVLSRENMYVIGQENKKIKKVPGASRYNATAVGTTFVSGIRYYSKVLMRKSFAYNTNGQLYFIDENGLTTAISGMNIFSPTAIPTFVNFRVSDTDILYFIEGIGSGMYSHDGNSSQAFTRETSVTQTFVGALSHLDRMFAFAEDSEDLLFSKNLVPTDFTDSTDAGTITIGSKRGSKIMQIALISETLFIFKNDSIWVLEGRTPNEFRVNEIHPYLGCAARHSVQNVETGIIFLGTDFEFYQFGGTADSLKLISYDLAFGGDFTKDLAPLLNRDALSSIRSIYHNHIYRCAYVENGGTTNNMEYCFNTINETDFLTRDFNISCYFKWDRFPDKNELIVGRVGDGRLMRMYQGLNVDNGATSPTMPFKTQTKFVGTNVINTRFPRAWLTCGVLGAEPISIRTFLDCRTANADATSEQWTIRGETRAVITGVPIASQNVITSRNNLRHNNSKGESISFQIDSRGRDLDFEFASISVEAITKEAKRSQRVSV